MKKCCCGSMMSSSSSSNPAPPPVSIGCCENPIPGVLTMTITGGSCFCLANKTWTITPRPGTGNALWDSNCESLSGCTIFGSPFDTARKVAVQPCFGGDSGLTQYFFESPCPGSSGFNCGAERTVLVISCDPFLAKSFDGVVVITE